MQQIADWLEKLGMSEYAQRFAENKIDLSVLPHLTDQDLKDIGVPLHRRKMLAAVAQLDDTSIADDAFPRRRECGVTRGRRERLGPSCACSSHAPGRSPRDVGDDAPGLVTGERLASMIDRSPVCITPAR
jgi:hypothetical protein